MGTDLSVVNAARVSFGTKKEVDEKDIKLINYLGPITVLLLSIALRTITVPLFIDQHHRHRTWAPHNEISRLYIC